MPDKICEFNPKVPESILDDEQKKYAIRRNSSVSAYKSCAKNLGMCQIFGAGEFFWLWKTRKARPAYPTSTSQTIVAYFSAVGGSFDRYVICEICVYYQIVLVALSSFDNFFIWRGKRASVNQNSWRFWRTLPKKETLLRFCEPRILQS